MIIFLHWGGLQTLSVYHTPLEDCLKQDCLAPPPNSFWFRRSWVGLENLHVWLVSRWIPALGIPLWEPTIALIYLYAVSKINFKHYKLDKVVFLLKILACLSIVLKAKSRFSRPARPCVGVLCLLLQAHRLLFPLLVHKAQSLGLLQGCPWKCRALVSLQDLRLFIPPLLPSWFLPFLQVTCPMTSRSFYCQYHPVESLQSLLTMSLHFLYSS